MNFLKINYLEKFTYMHNFSQIVSMFTLAFVCPLVIGIENYGLYASLYAIPGFFHGSLETYLIRTLNKNQKNFLSNFIFFCLISLIIIFCLTYFFFGFEMIFYSLILYIGLIFRSFFYSIATQKTNKLQSVIYSEWIISFVYVFILGYCYFNQFKSFIIPIIMIVASCFIGGVFLFYFSKSYLKNISFTLAKNHNFIDLFGRLYEDLFITSSPLIVYNFFGAKESGIFRILVSVLKALFD